MKFTPKELKENVNVSKTHPLAELSWLLGGVVLTLVLIYFLLGLTADIAISKMPVETETWFGRHFSSEYGAESDPNLQKELDALLGALPEASPLHKYNFVVSVVESADVNAVALPGGHIMVFSGLLDQVRSQNELAMVLAHELGHYAHRDHLRGMGRGLGLALLALLLGGENSSAAELITDLFLTFESRYSQSQESAADEFGLKLLVARYGHAGGGTDFFIRLSEKAGSKFPYLFASHPHPEDRIERLKALIHSEGYPLAETLPYIKP